MKNLIFVFLFTLSGPILSSNWEQLIHRQKALFQQKRWDSFFANALYLRSWLHQDKRRWDIQEIEPALALEVLALTQKCHYKKADDVAQEILEIRDFPLVKQAREQLELQKVYEHLDDQDEKASKKEKQISWPMTSKHILEVDHPKNLTLRLESKCKKGAS